MTILAGAYLTTLLGLISAMSLFPKLDSIRGSVSMLAWSSGLSKSRKSCSMPMLAPSSNPNSTCWDGLEDGPNCWDLAEKEKVYILEKL